MIGAIRLFYWTSACVSLAINGYSFLVFIIYRHRFWRSNKHCQLQSDTRHRHKSKQTRTHLVYQVLFAACIADLAIILLSIIHFTLFQMIHDSALVASSHTLVNRLTTLCHAVTLTKVIFIELSCDYVALITLMRMALIVWSMKIRHVVSRRYIFTHIINPALICVIATKLLLINFLSSETHHQKNGKIKTSSFPFFSTTDTANLNTTARVHLQASQCIFSVIMLRANKITLFTNYAATGFIIIACNSVIRFYFKNWHEHWKRGFDHPTSPKHDDNDKNKNDNVHSSKSMPTTPSTAKADLVGGASGSTSANVNANVSCRREAQLSSNKISFDSTDSVENGSDSIEFQSESFSASRDLGTCIANKSVACECSDAAKTHKEAALDRSNVIDAQCKMRRSQQSVCSRKKHNSSLTSWLSAERVRSLHGFRLNQIREVSNRHHYSLHYSHSPSLTVPVCPASSTLPSTFRTTSAPAAASQRSLTMLSKIALFQSFFFFCFSGLEIVIAIVFTMTKCSKSFYQNQFHSCMNADIDVFPQLIFALQNLHHITNFLTFFLFIKTFRKILIRTLNSPRKFCSRLISRGNTQITANRAI